jgi:hypothetical protein
MLLLAVLWAPARAAEPACPPFYTDLATLRRVSEERVASSLDEVYDDRAGAVALIFKSPETPQPGLFKRLLGSRAEAPLDRSAELKAYNDALVAKLESDVPKPFIFRVDASNPSSSRSNAIAVLEAEARKAGFSESEILKATDLFGGEQSAIGDFMRLFADRAQAEGRRVYFIADNFQPAVNNDGFALMMRSWQNSAASDEAFRSIVTVMTSRSSPIVVDGRISPYNGARHIYVEP